MSVCIDVTPLGYLTTHLDVPKFPASCIFPGVHGQLVLYSHIFTAPLAKPWEAIIAPRTGYKLYSSPWFLTIPRQTACSSEAIRKVQEEPVCHLSAAYCSNYQSNALKCPYISQRLADQRAHASLSPEAHVPHRLIRVLAVERSRTPRNLPITDWPSICHLMGICDRPSFRYHPRPRRAVSKVPSFSSPPSVNSGVLFILRMIP